MQIHSYCGNCKGALPGPQYDRPSCGGLYVPRAAGQADFMAAVNLAVTMPFPGDPGDV
jgi:hypothetical protein